MKKFRKWLSNLFSTETEAQKLMRETAEIGDLKDSSGKMSNEKCLEWLRNRSK